MPKTRVSRIEQVGMTDRVKELYLGGKSFSEVAKTLAVYGITEGMVAGFVFRNKIKRGVEIATVDDVVEEVSPATTYSPPKPEIETPRHLRRFNVMSWTGDQMAGPITAEDVINRYISYLSAEEFHERFERTGEISTTSVLIALDDA